MSDEHNALVQLSKHMVFSHIGNSMRDCFTFQCFVCASTFVEAFFDIRFYSKFPNSPYILCRVVNGTYKITFWLISHRIPSLLLICAIDSKVFCVDVKEIKNNIRERTFVCSYNFSIKRACPWVKNVFHISILFFASLFCFSRFASLRHRFTKNVDSCYRKAFKMCDWQETQQ